MAMDANPFQGVLLHWIGGLAAASFYVPYRRVRHWSWETYWLTGGVFSWLVAPWVLALCIVPDTPAVLAAAPAGSLFWTFFFGVMWGIGGLTFGLTMRYLGIALGYAVALGFCAAFGTLVPPIWEGKLGTIVGSTPGRVVLLGVVVCLVGIAASGAAGRSKERELSDEEKKAAVREFSFAKGLVVAVFCGIMSACMSFAFAAGKPISELAVQHGAPPLWQNLPVLIVALAGGFLTNCVWCLALNVRNRSGGEYARSELPAAGSGEPAARVPLLANYLFCMLAGVTWYLQFFFYGMGTTKMGRYDFSSWTLHMASIIIFSTLWGWALQEWRGTSRRTHIWITRGLLLLIASTVVVGIGNWLALNH